MNDSVTVTLRNVETSDISIFFEHQLDAEANRMAAFVREDPHDRAALDNIGSIRVLQKYDFKIIGENNFCTGKR